MNNFNPPQCFDHDNNGIITCDELSVIFKGLGQPHDLELLEGLVAEVRITKEYNVGVTSIGFQN